MFGTCLVALSRRRGGSEGAPSTFFVLRREHVKIQLWLVSVLFLDGTQLIVLLL